MLSGDGVEHHAGPVPPVRDVTLPEAITALLDDFRLEDFEEVYRDDAKQDRAYTGLSEHHPRVQRFHEVCRTLRQAVGRSL